MSATTLTARRRERVLPPAVTGQELILIGVIALLWVLLALANPGFLAPYSIQNMLWRLAPVGIMAIGMTIIIVTAGIDISIAAILMVCSVTIAKLIAENGWNFWLAVGVSLVIGAALGAINGVLISYGRVPAIIITFGTANLFQFLGLRIFNSKTVNGLPAERGILGPGEGGRFLGLPIAFIIMVVLVAFAWYYLRHFPGGRHFYAIGDDERAAALAGVNVRRRIFLAYLVTGLLVGLAAAITIAGGTSTLDQNVGKGQELVTIAATVIGGTSIMGGRGSVLGAVLGALLVQTVSSGVTQLGWPSQLSNLFVGLFIVVAVGADLIRERRRKAKL
ncbi:MAG: ABC transporter permease [Propionibacteriaceae bacterium]|jgi:ribose transport system permease protein|nr:ABC transporter permease [Propionibacteriaceae bacterium]